MVETNVTPSDKQLPIGVVIPTRNCAGRLPAHLKAVSVWLQHVEQVVVVDSFSTDGTYELLRSGLAHPRLEIQQRPPGLYECWNHGIQQVKAEWVYISTVGDTIDLSGIKLLLKAAQQSRADVVLSPPEFVNEYGTSVREKTWPIHDVVRTRSGQGEKGDRLAPFTFSQWSAFVMSFLNAPQGMLGSSAANLYLTRTLQTRPFPTDYGHFGDSAWTLANAFAVSWVVLPAAVSRFILHDSGVSMEREKLEGLRDRLFDLGLRSLPGKPSIPQMSDASALLSTLRSFPDEFRNMRRADEDYSRARKKARPLWILSPEAWRARSRRSLARQRVKAARDLAFRQTAAMKPEDARSPNE